MVADANNLHPASQNAFSDAVLRRPGAGALRALPRTVPATIRSGGTRRVEARLGFSPAGGGDGSLVRGRRRRGAAGRPQFTRVARPGQRVDVLGRRAAGGGNVDRRRRTMRATTIVQHPGLLSGIATLRDLQERRQSLHGRELPPFPFADEQRCEMYLAKRFRRGQSGCPACRALDGYFLAGAGLGNAALAKRNAACERGR